MVPVKTSCSFWVLLLATTTLQALRFSEESSYAVEGEAPGTTPANPWGEHTERQQCNSDTMTSTKTLDIAPDLSLTLLQDASQFLEGTEGDGTGTVVWSASICLAKYVHYELILKDSAKVLELGSGVGLPTLVAAKKCQTSCQNRIFATDSEEATLQQLIAVAKLNNLQEKLTALKFDWNSKYDESDEKSWLTMGVDILLASDVIYSRSMVEPLVRTIQRIISQSSNTGTAYLAFKNSRPGVQYFVEEAMPKAGFDLIETISCQPYLRSGDDSANRWEGDTHSIYIFQSRT